MTEPLLAVDDLTIQYETEQGPVTAVSDVSFTIERGEYVGLVGESGCGKSTLAKSVIGGLDNNGSVTSGTIRYKGEEIQGLTDRELNESVRWTEISTIPQASMNCLDPVERLSDQAYAIARTHTDYTKREALDAFEEMFETVGLQKSRIDDYPHQFSGGMQQRAIIALSLFLEPDLIIADEPTTALDVIMQDQILKHFDSIKDSLETSMLMITHDISLVFESCEKIAVMHGGQLAERGAVTDVFAEPRHPYSILLQRAFPDIRNPDAELETIDGYPPETLGDIDYCTFVDRCPWADGECRSGAPPLDASKEGGTEYQTHAACFKAAEVYADEYGTN